MGMAIQFYGLQSYTATRSIEQEEIMKKPTMRCNTLFCKNAVAVRWRLEYCNKPAKFGLWNQEGPDAYAQAISQDRDGLVYACVEIKELNTRKIKVLARCSAADYVCHRWIVATPATGGGKVKVQGGVQGMSLVTRDQKLHVFRDGFVKIEEMKERAVSL